jgi:hypothetical protein
VACQVYYLSLLFLDGSQTTVSALERVNKGDSEKRRRVYQTMQGTSELRKFSTGTSSQYWKTVPVCFNELFKQY